jgi:UDP-4-amino-4,6-dideoxy-N-acetyl-beta-L-altrosamine transaminase
MRDVPALFGGIPIRPRMLPYGHQWIDEEDVAAVKEVLLSDYLTTGPGVAAFETAFAEKVGARHAVAVSSGTAALHAALHAAGIEPGDEVITTPLTFAADANAVLYLGGRPVFADIDPETLLIDPSDVARRMTPRTKAIIAVDYAGQPADIEALRSLAERRGLVLVEDACHSLGAHHSGRPVGSLAALTAFSFHPVKHVTTGEGGMVTTDDDVLARRLRTFRNHGITTLPSERVTWEYEMVTLGFNYRLSDIHAVLGLSQLRRLDTFITRRREIAAVYDRALQGVRAIRRPQPAPGRDHVWHLYVIQLELDRLSADRAAVLAALRAENIGVNVHYIPVYFHPYYRELGYERGSCPVAETAYERVLSLPIFPRMSPADVEDVLSALRKVIEWYSH